MSHTSLPGNPHAEPANYAEIEASPYTKAQAILALAYEQRTANLLALLATENYADVNYANVLKQVIGRMDL